MTQVRDVGGVLLIGNHRIHPLTKISAAQAMSVTCFGSLAFCCDLSRECRLRDDALQLLGMDKEEYSSIQQECHQRFLYSTDQRWPHDILIQPAPQPTSFQPTTPLDEREHKMRRTWPTRATHQDRTRTPTTPLQPSKTSDTIVDIGGLFESSSTGYKDHSEDTSPLRSGTIPQAPFTLKRRYSQDDRGHLQPTHTNPSTLTPSTSRRFCVYCGQDMREDADFCNRCRRSQK